PTTLGHQQAGARVHPQRIPLPNLEPFVSIVILNWNGLEDTRECLQSLRRIGYSNRRIVVVDNGSAAREAAALRDEFGDVSDVIENETNLGLDRKSTRLNSSHVSISYAVFCLKKKK